MIRSRFTVKDVADYRPVKWPIKHPYWCTGYDVDDNAIIVAYADNEDEILELWPEAENIDSEDASDYVFTGRFPKPDWLEND